MNPATFGKAFWSCCLFVISIDTIHTQNWEQDSLGVLHNEAQQLLAEI